MAPVAWELDTDTCIPMQTGCNHSDTPFTFLSAMQSGPNKKLCNTRKNE